MMSDIEKDIIKAKDELIEMYKDECELYRKEIKERKEISDKSNLRMFIVAIVSIVALIIVVFTLVTAHNNSQKTLIDFFNQYEYSSEVTTQTYEVKQENGQGDNNNYIGNEQITKGGE